MQNHNQIQNLDHRPYIEPTSKHSDISPGSTLYKISSQLDVLIQQNNEISQNISKIYDILSQLY